MKRRQKYSEKERTVVKCKYRWRDVGGRNSVKGKRGDKIEIGDLRWDMSVQETGRS